MTDLNTGHDRTHAMLDKTREDVRRLHPLLQLLDPDQADITTEFAVRLIGLLVEVEERLTEQTAAFMAQTAEMSGLRSQLDDLQADMAFLMGSGDPVEDGSR
ncbi:hypothetical protein AN189_12560 [Loktanella sp. 3ANDIMAR09]|uniref:hypothetical protein n=1 Tax=Loktanella sp. 3ANDIMAR09 TaxID=1225657 RepID=UPI0006FC2B65|nr:hypothetical protein [Loktanella sp. 3ANDIMAR09]KQI67915.1 hypothetical protein AN189_12560 [Loktanella sp. 3ANDIMAR09]